jgi:hypothetical protein
MEPYEIEPLTQEPRTSLNEDLRINASYMFFPVELKEKLLVHFHHSLEVRER